MSVSTADALSVKYTALDLDLAKKHGPLGYDTKRAWRIFGAPLVYFAGPETVFEDTIEPDVNFGASAKYYAAEEIRLEYAYSNKSVTGVDVYIGRDCNGNVFKPMGRLTFYIRMSAMEFSCDRPFYVVGRISEDFTEGYIDFNKESKPIGLQFDSFTDGGAVVYFDAVRADIRIERTGDLLASSYPVDTYVKLSADVVIPIPLPTSFGLVCVGFLILMARVGQFTARSGVAS